MHRLFGFLALLASVSTAASVRAASCDTPFGFHVLPNEGAAVPRNTRVWLPTNGADSPRQFRWRDTDGVAVAFSVKHIPIAGGLGLDVLSPDEPLRFPATYQVEVCSQEASGERCLPRTMFSTLDEIDEEPPPLPQVEEWMRNADEGDFGEQRVVIFSAKGEPLVFANADGKALDSPLDDEGAELVTLTARSHVYLGYGGCSRRNIEGDRAEVRFASFDLAGNFSGYTEPQSVKLPELDGCSLSIRQGGGWVALLLLVALLRRRAERQARARSHRPRKDFEAAP